MSLSNIYQSEYTGPQMDSKFSAVATLHEAVAALETAVAAKYSKPDGGIPSTDMDADVQAALALALTAVQSLADYYTKAQVDAIAAAIASAVNSTSGVTVTTLPSASADTLGKIYYVGPDGNGEYSRKVTSYDGTTYSWLDLGTTAIDLTQYATKAELSQLDQEVNGVPASETELVATSTATSKVLKQTGGTIGTTSATSVISTYSAGPGTYKISGRVGGTSGTCLAVFYDEDNNVLGFSTKTTGTPTAYQDVVVEVPTGTVKIDVAGNTSVDYAPKCVLYEAATPGLKDDVDTLKRDVPGLVWVNTDTLQGSSVASLLTSYVVKAYSVDVTIDQIFIYDKKDGEFKTFYADGDASSHQPKTYAMGVNPGNRNLVIDSDGNLKLRNNASGVKATDFILLRYDTNVYNMVGGALYADFIHKTLSARIEEFEEIKQDVIPSNIGQVNCVRKALQMTSLKWTPKAAVPNNTGSFSANAEVTGLVYSSVKEYDQWVFLAVSLETFMTAVHNVRSVLYTENVGAGHSQSALGRTYHGTNCACYYGSVCSSLVSFAYGLEADMTTKEFRNWDRMEVLEDQSPYGLAIGDAIWESGHIQVVIGIKKDSYGVITAIQVAESAGTKAHINNYTASTLQTYINSHSAVLMRYKDLYKNREYTPQTDFVAIQNEVLGSYTYNDDICPNYGEKSNYNEGDDVVLNLRSDYASEGFDTLEVYKGETLVISRAITDEDEVLTGLSYGTYKARITGTGVASEYAHFIVVNASVTQASDSFAFASENATPVYYEFVNEAGSRNGDAIVGRSTRMFTLQELSSGVATPTSPIVADATHPYLKVHFRTEYGLVIKVIEWTI